MRGQRIVPAALAWPLRIIPARAGPTGPTATKAATRPDHPRSCGANLFARVQISDIRGSSPLVRGQPTPVSTSFFFGADHPRSCGANCVSWRVVVCTSGSSPLVRGQHLAYLLKSNEWRIIPARAGPTKGLTVFCKHNTDHPRSCGANAVCDIGCKRCCGSSPLVRGQPRFARAFQKCERIIPARAGPTGFSVPACGYDQDHPRSCGANRTFVIAVIGVRGSSPLVRGQLNAQTATSVYTRIIPARAGPTHVRSVDVH